MDLDLIDALRGEKLDAATARELLDRAASLPADAGLAIIRDEAVAPVARRVVIRRLLEAEPRAGATLAELGALVAADAWLQPTHARHVSVVGGKLPVQWLAEDLVVAIDVCPAAPGDGDRHRLLLYLRVAGQPELEEIIEGLRGGAGGGHEVREIGFVETEAQRPGAAPPRPPVLGALVLCRRALCDTQTGMHTLVDVVVELPAHLPGPAMFDIYLQLRRITGPSTLAIEVIGPAPTDDGADDGVVLTTGMLTLGAPPEAAAGPPPRALGVAIPNVAVAFERAGEHRLRVRCGGEILGEHTFEVVDGSAS